MNAIEIFLILCLGHLASDFLLQTDAMVKAKKHGGEAYWKHGLIHYVAILVVTAACGSGAAGAHPLSGDLRRAGWRACAD